MKRLALAALGLAVLVFCTSCESAAEKEKKEFAEKAEQKQKERKQEVSQVLALLLDQRFPPRTCLSQEDQTKWGIMRDLSLLGLRVHGFLDWDITELTATTYQVEGFVWYEGVDAAGQDVKRQTKLSLTMAKGKQPEEWRLISYQIVEPKPLSFWQQLLTWAAITCVSPLAAMAAFFVVVSIPWGWVALCIIEFVFGEALANSLWHLFGWVLIIVGVVGAIVGPVLAGWWCFHSYLWCIAGTLVFFVLYLAGLSRFLVWWRES